MNREPLVISITPGSIVAAIGIILIVWLLFFLKGLVFIILTAIVIASSIEPGVVWLTRRSIPRVLAVTLVYLIVLGLLFGVAYLMFPPILTEASAFLATLPAYLDTHVLESLLSSKLLSTTKEVVVTTPSLTQTILEFQKMFTSTGEGAFRAVSAVFGGVFSFFLILLLSFYFALQETGIDDFLRIVSPVKYQGYIISLWRRSQAKIGLWMQGQLILSLIMGILGYLWLAILQVPYAFLIAVFAALIEVVPVFGSFISGAIAVLIAAAAGGPPLALLVAGGFIVINQLQSHLIYPLVVKQVVGVPPLLVILALIAGGQLAGFLGVLLSVPVAAALRELVSDIQQRKEAELAGAE